MDRLEIVAYRANVCVDLSGPARSNGHLAMISIHEGENNYNKTGRQEVDPLAYLRPKTVQTMGGSSGDDEDDGTDEQDDGSVHRHDGGAPSEYRGREGKVRTNWRNSGDEFQCYSVKGDSTMKRMMFAALVSFWMLSGAAFAHPPDDQKQSAQKREMVNQCRQMMQECCPTAESGAAKTVEQAWRGVRNMQSLIRGIQRAVIVPVL